MNYIIMLAIVILLAVFDWITGFVKAYCLGKVASNTMRMGGLKKLAEITVMLMGIVLDIGINMLSTWYGKSTELASLLGIVCALAIFIYIVIMEVVSILENYAAVFPDAAWALQLTKKLKNIDSAD